MKEYKANEFFDNLTEEQRRAAIACKTEDELERVINDYDIEIPDDMLDGVQGGRGFLQTAIASAIVFTSAAAVVADPSKDGTIFSQTTISAEAADYGQIASETAINTGIACFGQFVPYGRAFTPILEGICKCLGLKTGGVSTTEINKNIIAMRKELNARLDEIDKNMNQNTTAILNKITNQSYISGLGTELDNMHTSAASIASQIDTLNGDTSLTDDERAVEIAALIGNNYEWTRTGSFVFNIKKLANFLSGGTFSDMGNRDMYQVLYDNAKADVMFSGEAYDSASPYVDRVMYEYFYDYTVMMQCFDSARTVSQFTPEQIGSLSEKTRTTYNASASKLSLVNNEVRLITNKLYDAEREDSVISHYALFKYKKDHDRNVYINHGTNGSGVAFTVNETKVSDWWHASGDGRSLNVSGLDNAVKKIKSVTRENGQLSVKDVKTLYEYARRTYPDITFREYLAKMGISIPYTTWGVSMDFAAAADTGGRTVSGSSYVSGTNVTYLTVVNNDAKGSAPSYIDREVGSISYYMASNYSVVSTCQVNETHLLTFEKGKSAVLPAIITADSLLELGNKEYKNWKAEFPDLGYSDFEEYKEWKKEFPNGKPSDFRDYREWKKKYPDSSVSEFKEYPSWRAEYPNGSFRDYMEYLNWKKLFTDGTPKQYREYLKFGDKKAYMDYLEWKKAHPETNIEQYMDYCELKKKYNITYSMYCDYVYWKKYYVNCDFNVFREYLEYTAIFHTDSNAMENFKYYLEWKKDNPHGSVRNYFDHVREEMESQRPVH